MTKTKVLDANYQSAKEKLAGIAASRAWIQDLTAAHLLRTQQPIRDEPIDQGQGEQ